MVKGNSMSESYQHLIAKQRLAHWFKQTENCSEDFCQLVNFSWRKNYGVHVELPFFETSNEYYFEDGVNKGKVLFRPDVTVFHKGVPLYLFEICCNSSVSKSKIRKIMNFFKYNLPYVYEFDVREIVKYFNFMPTTKLECRRIL